MTPAQAPPDNTPHAGTRTVKDARRPLLVFALLVTATVLFRVPALLNAQGVHSDAAIVGLQAQHILQGEWSWLLWGAHYQASIDAFITAAAFALTGPSALVLMVVPLLGHIVLLWFAFRVILKHTSVSTSAIAVLPLIFTPYSLNGVILYPPRQWCVTLAFVAVWLLDGISEAQRPRLRAALAAFTAAIALHVDLFALSFVLGLALFALACAIPTHPTKNKHPTAFFHLDFRRAWPRFAALAMGLLVGLSILWATRLHLPANALPTGTDSGKISEKLALLWTSCLPWILSIKIFIPWVDLYRPQQWTGPLLLQVVQAIGGATLVAGIVSGGASLFSRQVPWPLRRLGLLGCAVSGSCIFGFLLSVMPRDVWAARYLAPIIWTAPFAIAPAARALGSRRLSAVLAPYLISAALAGWLAYGPYVRGPIPVADSQDTGQNEAALGAALRDRGVTHAAADYWLAYRLTFLWNEAPIVIPLNGLQDRYPPYRAGMDDAATIAFIFHPWATTTPLAPWLRRFEQGKVPYERVDVADFVALIVKRP